MRRLLRLLQRYRPVIATLYRVLLLIPVLSGEMVLSMISIAGLTLTTLPPFSRIYRRAEPPQLEQRIEKQIFDAQSEDDRRLSDAIRSELQRAAQLLPTDPAPPPKEEIVDAEWEEAVEERWTLAPAPLPDYPRPIQPLISLTPADRTPSLPRYPVAAIDLLTPPQSRAIPHYPQVALALSTETRSVVAQTTPLPHYPRSDSNLLQHAFEEAAFDEEPPTPIEEPGEAHSWLPTRERADALFAIAQLYNRLDEGGIPLSILIGENSEDELLQLSSESLDGAITLKEEIDTLSTIFGFDSPQLLFDHLFYCSISPDRSERLAGLLSAITPLVMESLMVVDRAERTLLYQQIFEQLLEAGEFLSSEQPQILEKWHEEFIPPEEPEQEELEEPLNAEPPPSADERIAAALENLQRQQELELETPEQREKSAIKQERAQLSRKRKIKRVDALAKQQGLPLNRLLDDTLDDPKENQHLLDLLLSARSEPAEEYIHHRSYLRGTPADLLIESLLRIKLQNRTCSLYMEHRHLQSYEAIEQQIFETLGEEFGSIVTQNHRNSIEQHIEWASSHSRPHCSDRTLPQQVEF